MPLRRRNPPNQANRRPPTNLVRGEVAAFVAYGRLFVGPIIPASISTFRALKGLAVLGVPVLVDFIPVWYKLTHTHKQ